MLIQHSVQETMEIQRRQQKHKEGEYKDRISRNSRPNSYVPTIRHSSVRKLTDRRLFGSQEDVNHVISAKHVVHLEDISTESTTSDKEECERIT